MKNQLYIPFLELGDLPYQSAIEKIHEFARERTGKPIYVEVGIFDTNHAYPIDGTYIMKLYGWYMHDGSLLVEEKKLGYMFNSSGIEKSDYKEDYHSVFTTEQLEEMPDRIPNIFYLCNEDHIISVGTAIEEGMSNTEKKLALDREPVLEGAI